MVLLLFYLSSMGLTDKIAVALYTEYEPAIDGILTDSVWIHAYWYSNFSQMRPNYKSKSTNKTEFAVIYTRKKIIIGIKCYYFEKPFATNLKRDNYNMFEDGIQILLDPSSTRMSYYLFGVNYLNIQTDGTGTKTMGDARWDCLWQSMVVDEDSFYCVEIAIPLKYFAFQLRDTIGFNVIRSQYWNMEVSYWADMGSELNNPSLLGKLVIDTKKLIKEKKLFLYPYSTLRYIKEDTIIGGEIGGEIFGQPIKSLNIGFTFNPEYCEIEPDVDVISLVKGSEIYLPEKRLFFLEGFNLYSWNLFYTRRVSEILWGAKCFGSISANDYSLFLIQSVDTKQYLGIATQGEQGEKFLYNFSSVMKREGDIKLAYLSTFDYRPNRELIFDLTTRLNYIDTFSLKNSGSLAISTFYRHPHFKGFIGFDYSGAQSFSYFGFFGISLPYNQYTATLSANPIFYFKKIKEYSPSLNLSYTMNENKVRIKRVESFTNSLTISPMAKISLLFSNSYYLFPDYEVHNRLINTQAILGRIFSLSLGGAYGSLNDNRLLMPIIQTSATFRSVMASFSFQNKYLWENGRLKENIRLAILKMRFRPSDKLEIRTFWQYSHISKAMTSNIVVKINPVRYLTIYLALVDREDISTGIIQNTARRFLLKGVYQFSL